MFFHKVVCDGSNNTGEVIDRNEFVGDIYVSSKDLSIITPSCSGQKWR